MLITVEYRVLAERADDFIEAMDAMRIFRRREGAIRWDLFRDLADPDRYLETFTVLSWGEHMRQHARVTVEDQAIEARAFACLQVGVAPITAHLVVAGLLGVVMNLFFPQDPGGPPVTFAGTVHVVLAGVLSLGTMLAILGTGLWLRQMPGLRAYWRYSLVSLAVVFAFGGLGVAAIATSSPYLGLVERVTIGAFIQWIFVIALRLVIAASVLERRVTRAEHLAG